MDITSVKMPKQKKSAGKNCDREKIPEKNAGNAGKYENAENAKGKKNARENAIISVVKSKWFFEVM